LNFIRKRQAELVQRQVSVIVASGGTAGAIAA
jgi:hypothetical protein